MRRVGSAAFRLEAWFKLGPVSSGLTGRACQVQALMQISSNSTIVTTITLVSFIITITTTVVTTIMITVTSRFLTGDRVAWNLLLLPLPLQLCRQTDASEILLGAMQRCACLQLGVPL